MYQLMLKYYYDLNAGRKDKESLIIRLDIPPNFFIYSFFFEGGGAQHQWFPCAEG